MVTIKENDINSIEYDLIANGIDNINNELRDLFEKQNNEQAEIIKKHIDNMKLEIKSSLMQKFDEIRNSIE